jgi:hypothetical protein
MDDALCFYHTATRAMAKDGQQGIMPQLSIRAAFCGESTLVWNGLVVILS